MAEEKLKPTSFRIDEETAEKIRNISASIGGNQQETIAKLIEAYEFQKGKIILKEKKGDIEKFEGYTTVINRMFMDALEENQNIKEVVKFEFEAQLKSKDSIIQELQEKGILLKKRDEETADLLKNYEKQCSNLETEIKEIRLEMDNKIFQYETIFNDKEELNKVLTNSYNEQKKQIEEISKENVKYKNLYQDFLIEKQKVSELEKENEIISLELNKKINEIEKMEKDIEYETKKIKDNMAYEIKKTKEEQMLIFEKRILDIETENQNVVRKLDENKREEIDKYQNKYFELLKKFENL